MYKISFLSPVYNKESYISETIRSIQSQTLEDIEIAFIDDGSTDATPDIIKFYQRSDKRIKLYRYKKNKGLGFAWNYGIPLVESEIICVGSGDDLYSPDRAKITLKAFKKQIDVFYGSFWFCDYAMNKMEFKPAIPFNKNKLITPRIDGFCPQYIGHITMAYRKRIGFDVPHRDYKVGIDYPLLVDMANKGCKFGWTKEILAYARVLKSGVSISRRSEVINASV